MLTPPKSEPLVDIVRSLASFARGEHLQYVAGVRTWKLQDDLARYTAIIEATQPNVVVETGTRWGGSALFFAMLGVDVITVDVDAGRSAKARRTAPAELVDRITWLDGNAAEQGTVATVADIIAERGHERVMVSLDDLHTASHVMIELGQTMWPSLVTPGQYLVVEDAIFDYAPGRRFLDELALGDLAAGGPLQAIEQYLAGDPAWSRDLSIEAYRPTSHHPAGWWRRVG
jgi:cephalosporin hydroxylase